MLKSFKTEKEAKDYVQEVKWKIESRKKEAMFLEERGFKIMAEKVKKGE